MSRHRLTRAVATASVGVAARVAPALAPIVPAVAGALGLPRTLRGPGIALTFDDGPHPRGTPAVLAVLAKHQAHATFFCVGEQVERRPDLVQEIVAAGHAVALHGHRHRCHLRLSPRTCREDLARGLDVIGSTAGTVLPFHRPPYGVYTWSSLREVRRMALEPLLWSRWGRDWARHATPHSVARRAGHNLSGGDVVLLHDADHYATPDSWRATVSALPELIEQVRGLGLEPMPITA